MQNQEGLTPAQRELEGVLGSLQPAAGQQQRDRLMYRAGQVSMQRRNFFWPTIAAVLAVMLGASLAYRSPASESTERVVYVPMERSPAGAGASVMASGTMGTNRRMGQAQYIKLRDRVLTEGVKALPEAGLTPFDPQDELWRQLQEIRPLGTKKKGMFNEMF